MTSTQEAPATCAFCGARVAEPLVLVHQDASICRPCSVRLGRLLLDQPDALVTVWPRLWEDQEEPEPRIHREDGTTVELRQRTDELKQELSVQDRMQLAFSYGELGLEREQLLECAWVLQASPSPELSQLALTMLFSAKIVAPDAVARLRALLFPA